MNSRDHSRSLFRPQISLLFTLLLLIALILCSCCQSGSPMIFPGNEWLNASPAELDIDEEAMLEALKYLESECGKDGITRAMVIRNGYVVFAGDSIHKANNIYSSTKSFTSTILGLLIEDGKAGLETKAAEIDPGLAAGYPEVTLRHFATMTSGYSAPGTSRWNQQSEDWAWHPYEAGPPLFAPGTAFAYWDEAQMMFGRLLTMVAGQSLESILRMRIADPIGINPFYWDTEGEYYGIPINNGCTGLNLSASQLARFGLLFLNNGNWDGRQLVPVEWVIQATATQVPAILPVANTDRSSVEGSGNYGYNWWTNGEVSPGMRALPEAPPGLYYTSGFNNNMCFIVPEWNLVFVRTGMDGNPARGKKMVYNEFFRRLEIAILR